LTGVAWLSVFIRCDPLTYSVDALRAAILGRSHFALAWDLGVMTAFAVATIAVGTYAFARMKT
jgi:ABC-2 type transport system permease protein